MMTGRHEVIAMDAAPFDRVALVEGDVTRQLVDAIVNAAIRRTAGWVTHRAAADTLAALAGG